MKMKWLPMLKPDQNSSQELKKSPFEVINKENPNLPAGQQNIITAGAKVNELITSLSLLKMEKQQKQSLIAR